VPSTITRTVSTRLHHDTIEQLQELARERGTTLSSVLASIAREGLRKAA